jgi:hypothetical protein
MSPADRAWIGGLSHALSLLIHGVPIVGLRARKFAAMRMTAVFRRKPMVSG